MANRPAAIDADHLVANPRALDALNLLSPTTLIDGSVRTSPLKVRRNSQ